VPIQTSEKSEKRGASALATIATVSIPAQSPTELLLAWRGGESGAFDRLLPLVDQELRRLARQQMRRERGGHTLQATALVNEAYLRLVESQPVDWQSRAHFFAVAARIMRHILVDYARARGNRKRGGDMEKVSIDAALLVAEAERDLVGLDEALSRLEAIHPRQARIVELRFFGGLNVQETAEAIQVSIDTVKRDWRFAKLWLLRELGGTGGVRG
jgi:RNA polymerase sigma factor (TIGR02999 family)